MKLFLTNHIERNLKHQGGFTLIEMMVSVMIFTITVLVVVGALVSLEAASRKARAIRIASDNMGAALDSMSRNIRMGSRIHCGCGTDVGESALNEAWDCVDASGDGSGGKECIAFESQNGDELASDDQYMYKLENGAIVRSTDGGTTFIALTAPEITIEKLRFYAGGTEMDLKQAYVTIFIRGSVHATAKTTTTFDVQTTVAQRTPNYNLVPP